MIPIYRDHEGYEVYAASDPDSMDRVAVLKDGKRLDAESISVISQRIDGSILRSLAFIDSEGKLYHSLSDESEFDLREFIVSLPGDFHG